MNKQQIRVEKISYTYPAYPEEEETSESVRDHETAEKAHTLPKALDGVSLEIEEGQFICILGSNGSGKSTLARHLNALLVPGEGTVWINDLNTADESQTWNIRAQVGMVFQNPDNQMVSSRVDEEVAFGLENLGIPSGQIVQQVQDALESVGMAGYARENPYNLSGGQKQRVAVAGILAMKPKCIVLDESTAMLDPRGRAEIMNTVLRLNREFGITLICITHYMEEAVEADRVFVMHQGHILASGTPREVFAASQVVKKAGLQLPVICQLAEELRCRGFRIPPDVITAQELERFIEASAKETS